ncbi:MAG TPA: hypothetical protein VG389_24035, partial [Myxococcota bacterium]|nr:hypothetical protein [Myxococcota bacterium]
LWIVPEVEAAWTFLPALATLAEGHERRVALAACAAARTVAAAASGAGDVPLAPDDEPARTIAAAADRLAALSADPGAWADLRGLALETALSLDAAAGAPARGRDALVARLLADADPEVRRAAAALAPADLPALAALLADPDPAVARTAGAALAAGAAYPGERAAALAPLAAAALAWLGDARLAPADRAAAARILFAAGGDPAHDALLALAKAKATPIPLRETASRLVAAWKTPKPRGKTPKPASKTRKK